MLQAIRENIEIDFNAFRKESNYREHIAFLDNFREHFSDVVNSLLSVRGKRLVVFIDDLDRCSSDRIIQVLDAIKLFVDIPETVFLLGLDVDVVQKAIATKYEDDPFAQKEYLGKIVQLPFHLLPLNRRQMETLLNELDLKMPDDRCRRIFTTGLVPNPREIKRTVNVFALLWSLVKTREELSRIEPVRLAKVVVIQQGYPELHQLLQQRPDLLIKLEDYFRQEQVYAKQIAESASAGLPALQKGLSKRNELLDILSQRFDAEELRTLCFYLGVDYEDLGGEAKSAKARELIRYLEKSERIPDLVGVIREQRPDISVDEILLEDLDTTEGIGTPQAPEKPAELEAFATNDRLRRMLLLYTVTEIERAVSNNCAFTNLDSADVEEYFTLTSRADIGLVEEGGQVIQAALGRTAA